MDAGDRAVHPRCAMDADEPKRPFFLIVIDDDRGVFSVQGPLTDDRPWHSAARQAREQQRRIICGPTGTDRELLAAEFRRTRKLAGVPPGTIGRPIRSRPGRSAVSVQRARFTALLLSDGAARKAQKAPSAKLCSTCWASTRSGRRGALVGGARLRGVRWSGKACPSPIPGLLCRTSMMNLPLAYQGAAYGPARSSGRGITAMKPGTGDQRRRATGRCRLTQWVHELFEIPIKDASTHLRPNRRQHRPPRF